MRGVSVALITGLLLAGPALAASPMGQLKDIDGKVFVNRGEGFVQARGDTELYQGDRVMVGENASATVNYYLAECDVMLTATSMTTIAAKAPCQSGSTTSTQGLTFSESSGAPFVVGLGVASMAGLGIAVATGDSDRNQDQGRSP